MRLTGEKLKVGSNRIPAFENVIVCEDSARGVSVLSPPKILTFKVVSEGKKTWLKFPISSRLIVSVFSGETGIVSWYTTGVWEVRFKLIGRIGALWSTFCKVTSERVNWLLFCSLYEK